MPGRVFTSIEDFNAQLGQWLPLANSREHRRIGGKPADRHDEDLAAMISLPIDDRGRAVGGRLTGRVQLVQASRFTGFLDTGGI